MNDTEQRIAIAHATGQWKDCRIIPGGPHDFDMPVGKPLLIDGTFADEEEVVDNYLTDLNAMHEAETCHEMHNNQKWAETIVGIAFREVSIDFQRSDGWDWVLLVARLSAAQRAEAFLRTLDLWKP